jgi:galactokinase
LAACSVFDPKKIKITDPFSSLFYGVENDFPIRLNDDEFNSTKECLMSNPLPSARYLVSAPGRVNLLGEHVDYNDGVVLPMAIDRNVTIAANPRDDRRVKLHAQDLKQSVAFSLDQLETKKDDNGKALPAWALYPAGVAWILEKHGYHVGGIEAWFTSNVPIGSGLSSSAAVEVGFATLWQAIGGWQLDQMTIARLCQEAENKYVGVNCGLMDQFASAHGVEDHALYFDTRSLEWRPVPMPQGVVVVIADSKVRRSLANSAYNERRASCEEAVRLLKQDLPEIRALRDVSPEQFHRLAHKLPEIVRMRAQHVVEECYRVDDAAQRLESGDAAGFGKLMFEGHISLRDLYEVSVPELDLLVDTARDLPGCLGARLTGAGFGGCTVNLVAEPQAEVFIEQLKEKYLQSTGKSADIYLCRASQGPQVKES